MIVLIKYTKIKIGADFLSGFIGSKSLEEIKKEIDEKLKNYPRKIVIIIDDLDRCEPDEVLMMLNLIKNLGDFNSIIYLVSYDKEHIIKVLEDKEFSHDYIEKIINIERFIPIPGKEKLKKYFEEKFTKILKNLKKENTELFNEKKGKEIIDFLIKEFNEFFEKENLRFIKKLLNQLNVILQLNLEKEKSEIQTLSNEDFKNIFVINYCKLKDFKLFTEILKIKNNINKINSFDLNNNNIYEDFSYRRGGVFYNLFTEILGLDVYMGDEKGILKFRYKSTPYKEYLENINISKESYFGSKKRYEDQKIKHESYCKKYKFLKKFS